MKELYKVPAENVWYDFENEIELNYKYVAITGNHHFREYGDPTILSIINESYYDDETGYEYDVLSELKKITGYDWDVRTMNGYSQGDWQDLYYAVMDEYVPYFEDIDAYYMGKIDQYRDEEGCTYCVPHRCSWYGKSEICKYLGFPIEDTKIFEICDSHVVYDYKEVK